MDFHYSWFRTGFLLIAGPRRHPRHKQMNWTDFLILLATLWNVGSTQEPISSTTVVLAGYPAVLSCGYSSEQPPDSVDWYRLPGGLDSEQERTHLLYHDSSGTFAFGNYTDRATVVDNANLRLQTVYMSDNGDYECEVPTADYDTILSKVRLQVLEAPDGPRITGYSPPLFAGQTLHLRCESQIVGDVRPTLVWYNGSRELSRVEPSVWQPDTTTAVLNYVLDVSKYDNAKAYRCQALYRGPVGVREQKVTLDIRYAPTTSMLYPLGTQVIEGDDVLLRCVVDSNPPATVSWERLEGDMPTNHKLYEERHLLRIVGITRQFHGTYQCRADNNLGVSTTSVRLNILYAPSIASQVWDRAEALVGENFTRACVVDGNPHPAVRWSREGSEEVLDDPLYFSSINFTDDGSYICKARSSVQNFPESTAKFRLDVKGPPQIVKQNTIFSAKENDSVTLECEVESDPPATRVAWKWESNSIESGTVGRYSVRQKETPTHSILSTLTIKSVQASDFRSYQCLAVNLHGEETQVIVLERTTAPPPQPIPLVAIILPVILVFIMVILGLLYYLRKYWQRKLPWTPKYLKNKDMEMRAIEDDYLPPIAQDSASPMPLLPGDDPTNYYQEPDLIRDLEFPRDKLSLERVLGRGNFGQVIKAKAQGVGGADKPMTVAVKTTKDGSSADAKEDLLKELKMMKLIPPHPNVVMLIGYCTKTEPVYVIVEYCALGNLQNFLRKCRSKRDSTYANIQVDERLLTPRDLASFIWQIARGMAHVASLKIVHRDLASRNVLIDKNKVCKISDFGLSRDVYDTDNEEYEQKTQGRLPLRWMAPESLFDHVYSVKSDVWSYGITMWEVLTLACTPYPGLSPPAMMERLRNGFRMSKPVHCNDEVYDIMRKCWEDDPEDRPTFIDLVRLLEDVITKAEEYIHLHEIPAVMFEMSI